MWDLVPSPGIEPRAPALGAWYLTDWTTREGPGTLGFNLGYRWDMNSICRHEQVRARSRFCGGGWVRKGTYGSCLGNVGFVMMVEHLVEG